MARIVIIGASTGGLPAAFELNTALGHDHEITVISNTDTFHFIPSNPWVAVGWRSRGDISFPLRTPLEKKGIKLIAEAAASIDPVKKEITTSSGTVVAYDYLVIATGPRLAFDEVPGLGPEGHTASVCTIDHAEKAFEQYRKFLEDPGPIIVGAAQGASCFGPAYEFAFILDADLRKKKLRRKVPMTFITPEPYIGHMGLSGVGDSKGLIEHELRERHISWHTNTKIKRVEEGKMTVEVLNEGERELPFRYSMIIPAFKGVDVVAGVEGLCNPKGFVVVDEFQRSPMYTDIYAIGVSIAIAPPEATPLPVGVPKTGFMIGSMVAATVRNIKASIEGAPVWSKASWNAICLSDMGDSGIAFVAIPQIPPRDVTWAKKGRWVHIAKAGYEKYFLRKMKKGISEPFYEKTILNALKIKKLL